MPSRLTSSKTTWTTNRLIPKLHGIRGPNLIVARPYPTWSNTMTKLLLILMMVGVRSGCGGDSDRSTGPSNEAVDELLKKNGGRICFLDRNSIVVFYRYSI